MRKAGLIGAALGLLLLIALLMRANVAAMLQTLKSTGFTLLWLVPYRALYFLLYAAGWRTILVPYDLCRRATLGYLVWVTSVREAVDRLLPVASVGGMVVGVRLLRLRGIAGAAAGASVIVETVLTVIDLYAFTALGLLLLLEVEATGKEYQHFVLVFLFSLPVPGVLWLLLRHGSMFERLQRALRPIIGESTLSDDARSLDREVRASLRRGWTLLLPGTLQFVALTSASFEIWLALRLFGHPVDARSAVVLESLTQALRHLAFVVPGGIGVQEAGLILFGHALGITTELALAVSMAKRVRELICGIPPLLSWQWLEGRRLRS